ncbi:SRPBCC family protein [Saccharothrix coeruleofusca]|uniref:Cyclase n=1 Tax=Saccharothrix coeruleofusca TaxID=33919 RepID=A0A918AI51_9PSEU|nr:SRPBCC family protein [Saccharothrix coeruleofusca]MBP2334407.1 ribosome-associated toxin RatA of RatAB toxin-antitoxin module [Saccharothrix coeruleofusca]GGP41282.1 cyclase [Saccharothrix coeruleofusca]
MADESTQSIVIDAAPEQVLAVIADFAAYPEWANGIKRTEVLETGPDGRPAQVRFNIDQGPIKDEYVLAYRWADDGVSWELVRGTMQKSQQGSYRLTARGGATEVTYTLSVQLVVPMIGLFRRKAEKMIMDTALKELKRRVENAG